jgi:hypothetical protein
MYVNPTVAEFKTYFVRDFPFGVDIEKNVLDSDITRAMSTVTCQINDELFCSQDEYEVGYMLLTAHFLVTNIQTSSQGLSSQFEWNTVSKGVGSVSVSQNIPESIMSNPNFAWLTKTGYGAQYLMMIYPRLSGQMFIAQGGTQA